MPDEAVVRPGWGPEAGGDAGRGSNSPPHRVVEGSSFRFRLLGKVLVVVERVAAALAARAPAEGRP